MSESENLNFESPSGHRLDSAEQVLQSLQPQPLEVSRDELFFQAGFAAGKKHSRASYFWPSAVAALLLICAGLGAALISNAVSINRMQQALVATENMSVRTVARSESETSQQADKLRTSSDSFFANRQQQSWLRLASAAPLPPGRLTAMGWEELPREMGSGDSESTRSTQPETAPRRPATYLELMRLQREG